MIDAEQCLFPQVASANTGQQQEQARLELQGLNRQVLDEFCTHRNVALPTIFKTAWAILLQRYLGTDEVGFCSILTRTERNGLSLGRYFVGGGRRISEVLQEVEKDYVKTASHEGTSLSGMHEIMVPSGRSIFNSIVIVDVRGRGEEGNAPGDMVDEDIAKVRIFFEYEQEFAGA